MSTTVPAAPTDDPAVMRKAWQTVGVVWLASFQTAMTLSVVFVVFADLERSFPEASPATLSWVVNAFTIVSASTIILGSAVADRWGRKRSLITGTTLFAAGSLVCATAPIIPVLIAGRVLQGLGAALQVPASLSLVLDAFPLHKRGLGVGVMTLGGAAAAGAGPSLGGIVIDLASWRWAFGLMIPVAATAVAVGWRVLDGEADRPVETRLPDPWSSVMIAAGVGSVVLALVQSDDWGWGDTRTLVAMALGGILLAGVVVRSLHHPRPIIDLGLYRFGSFRTANVAITCFALSFFTMQFAAVQYLTEVWGYEIRDAGLLSAPVFFLTGITGPIAGRLADRHGPVRVVTSGTLAWAAIVAVLWSVVGTEPAPGTWLAFSVTGGIGAGLFWGAILTLTAQDLTTANFAQASGLNQTLQNLGNVFAIALTITLLGSEVLVDDFDAVFGLVVGAALAAFAVLLTGRATPART